ncbi:hypothetical protein [Ruminococcus flavefaciens]|uniref:AAA-like domain-containing protein n=1 Tax=Ruminococcus flavefaciens TaxID=1265 RepID=A0A1K1NBK7_RUMFL|nr:hypothetical protein [Ruminococcus flavefaciens]SFW32692.1 hypothetical protein SAMN02910280_1795 [Ruminococcus flavefaciens]
MLVKIKHRNVFNDIHLEPTWESIDTIADSYHKACPSSLPVKVGTVLSVMSRLLPQHKELGLTQDRAWVIETSDDDTARFMTAVIQNRNHRSVEPIFSHMRMTSIVDELSRNVDCTSVFQHNFVVDKYYDLEKVLKLMYKQLHTAPLAESVGRTVPILIIDSAGAIPDEFWFHQLSISNSIKFEDISPIQKVLGELNHCVIKYAEDNPDAIKRELKEAIGVAREQIAKFPYRVRSSSAVMFLSTAKWLVMKGIMYNEDIQEMLCWLQTEVNNRSTLSKVVVKEIIRLLSNVILSGRLKVGNASSPPYWNPDMAFISSDGAINLTRPLFVELILSQFEVPIGHNKVFQALKADDLCYANPGEDMKTRTVNGADGAKNKMRFVSLSKRLMSEEANRIVDMTVASDMFHKLDKPIDNFFPFIKHRRLDMVAGQIITDYKHGTPFVAVTGAQGSGKTDWIMMQMLQRAKAGDVVIVLDPTNAFCREELSAHMVPDEIIDEYVEFWDMSTDGFPVNIPDYEGCTNIQQKVERLSSLLISGMHLTGPMQKLILVSKVREWLADKPINNTYELPSLRTIMGETADEKKLRSRMNALFSTVNMYSDVPFSWADRLSAKGKILVISSGNANINEHANPFDIVLDSLYSYKDIHREEKVTIIMDEFQTLNRYKGCTLEAILSRGRKLNLSAILASQDYTDKKDPIGRFYAYCGTHVFFRPLGEEGVKTIAELTKLDANVIRTLPDFSCAVLGPIYSEYYQKNIQLNSAIVGENYRPDYVGSYD